jgi:hypothetical protein
MPRMHVRLPATLALAIPCFALPALAQDAAAQAAPAPAAPAQAPEVPLVPEPAAPAPPAYTPAPTPAPLPPPEYRYVPPPIPVHAPRFSLWAGGLLSFETFGNSFFRNERGVSETTGNFIKPGLGTQIDIGARLEKRYIPYLTYERLWSFGDGRRFAGADSNSYAQFYGFGFRYLFGNPDFLAGFTDLSFGRRIVSVSSGGKEYSMSTFEFLRLGLGAEIRFTSKFSISPQVTLSSGVMQGTSGTVTYSASRQGDGITQPRYKNGESIEDSTSYIVLGLGVGAHVDLFGK